MTEKHVKDSDTLGWREWVGLPHLGIHRIKAKIDTGARTSALHAFEVTPYDQDGEPWVRFSIHPVQRRNNRIVTCTAPVKDRRVVRDSGGHEEERFVIESLCEIGNVAFPLEMTLTARDNMAFRMLLGRTAVRRRFLVDVSRSYVQGKSR